LLKLFGSLKQYSASVAGVLILVFFQSLSQLYLPTLMADIVDIGVIRGDTKYILWVGGLMLVVALVGMGCTILSSFLSAKVTIGFSAKLREKVFRKVESFSLREFDDLGTSSLITRTTNDITQIERVLMLMLRMMVSAPLMIIGGIVMAVTKDMTLSLVIVVVIPIIALVIWIAARKGLPLFKEMQKKLDKLNLVAREGLTGVRVIRAFNRNDYEKERFQRANHDLTGTALKVNRIMAAVMPLMLLVMNFTTIAIIWFGGIRIEQGYLQVGEMMAFIQYVMLIMFSLIMVSMMFVMVPRALVSAGRINEILDTVPEIENPLKAKEIKNSRGVVEFRNVTFSYPQAEKPVLQDISFCAGPGQVTAIIGGTGSGKSTLMSLIPRFYDVNQGSILVDGVDIREISQKELRAKIGFVPQKAVLFTGTIADNIRYGKENATEEEIISALETAQAMEFIKEMKDGLDSLIAQGGNNLSGGQKQRLAIARALIRKPEIYIFDDSFSALDFKTDANLRKALEEEIKNKTVFIVAQRISTIRNADQIIVLDKGRIAGSGRHKELLTTCEIYREIASSQLAEEESA